MAEEIAKKNGLQNEIKAAMGQYNMDEGKEQLKTEVSTFNKGGVYVGLKLVSDYDRGD